MTLFWLPLTFISVPNFMVIRIQKTKSCGDGGGGEGATVQETCLGGGEEGVTVQKTCQNRAKI